MKKFLGIIFLMVSLSGIMEATVTKRTTERYILEDSSQIRLEYVDDIPAEFNYSELKLYNNLNSESRTFIIRQKNQLDIRYLDTLKMNFYYRCSFTFKDKNTILVLHEYIVEIDEDSVIVYQIIQNADSIN